MAGMQVFTSSGTFYPVAGRTYKIICVGGGGGGGYHSGTNYGTGGNAGSVIPFVWTAPDANPIAVTVGNGGNGGVSSVPSNPTSGQTSSFGTIVSALGGTAGTNAWSANYATGGTPIIDLIGGKTGFTGISKITGSGAYESKGAGAGGSGSGTAGVALAGAAGAVIVMWQ